MNPIPPPERDKNGHLKAGIRLPGWDYCKPWIYMITLVVKRRRPVLGEITDGAMKLSSLGEAVVHAWRNLGNTFPEVEPCQYAVMPEHFHGIIWVHKRLSSPLGEVIRSFKIACTKANLALAEPVTIDGSTTFWFPGLYDTILFSRGQLRSMTRYVLRNAERRWAVMQNPDLFKTTRNVAMAQVLEEALGERWAKPDESAMPAASSGLPSACDVVGNLFLLGRAHKLLVQISRRATPGEIEAKVNEALLFANRGGVIVSGCISPGERLVARAVREAGLPLIAIIPRGFGPYFKPSGSYFDACAAGRLLMLSPFPQIGKADPLTRARCFGINAVAAAICGDDPAAIHYHGSQPTMLHSR